MINSKQMKRHFLRYLMVAVAMAVGISVTAQTVKIREQHKVKKSETIYGIARQYGITTQELEAANPEMRMEGYTLKKGDYINIPFGTDQLVMEAGGQPTSQTSQQQQQQQQQPVTQPVSKNLVRVGVMLPLHNNDGDGMRMVEYYRGLLLACERVAIDGITVDMHAWNVPRGADITKTIKEHKEEAGACDIIIGPLYSDQVKPLAEFCKSNSIRHIIPFSIEGEPCKKYETVYQVFQSNSEVEEVALAKFFERFAAYHPVVIDCADPGSTKGKFTAALRSEMEKRGMQYSLTSLNSSDADFTRAFDLSRPNVVILNTEKSPKLNDVFAKLNILTEANKSLNISMMGYIEWLMYTKPYQDLYFKYDTYIPTYFFYNDMSKDTKWVEKQYKDKFNLEMDIHRLPRFGLTGFDHGCYFIGGVAQFGSLFKGAKGQLAYKTVQTPMHFRQVGKGLKNANFMFVHYLPNRTIESINY